MLEYFLLRAVHHVLVRKADDLEQNGGALLHQDGRTGFTEPGKAIVDRAVAVVVVAVAGLGRGHAGLATGATAADVAFATGATAADLATAPIPLVAEITAPSEITAPAPTAAATASRAADAQAQARARSLALILLGFSVVMVVYFLLFR